jgi:hypothetical protein
MSDIPLQRCEADDPETVAIRVARPCFCNAVDHQSGRSLLSQE